MKRIHWKLKLLVVLLRNFEGSNSTFDLQRSTQVKIVLLFEFFSLHSIQHVDSPTHSAGGLLDVVITRSDCNIGNLCVDPPTISDHGLVTCTVPYACPASPVFTSRRVRGWKRLDRVAFHNALSSWPLCRDDDYYRGLSATELYDIYSSSIIETETPDRLAPWHNIASRYRPSTPWFDADCWSIKRGARLLERRYRRTKDPLDRLTWTRAIRDKRAAFKSKENESWENIVVRSNSSNPKKLWRSVSTILGEPSKQTTNCSTFSASDFLSFLEQKVETIRSDTAGSAPPSSIKTNELRTLASMLIQYEFSRSTGLVSQTGVLVSHPTWLGWLFGVVLHRMQICGFLPPHISVYSPILFQAWLYWARFNPRCIIAQYYGCGYVGGPS